MNTNLHSTQLVVWSPGVSIETMIQSAIESALSYYKGNKTATAHALGISIRTLDTRLDKYKKERLAHEQRAADAQSRRAEFHARQRAVPQNGQFDTSATPSIHAAEAARRRAESAPAPKDGKGPTLHVSGEGVREKPAAEPTPE